MNETKTKRSTFDLQVFFHNFRLVTKRIFWIPIFLSVIMGVFEYYTVSRNYFPLYESKAVFSVSANYSSTTDIMSYSYYYDNNAASRLASTFYYIITTDVAMQLIYNELGTTNIGATVTARCVADSNMFVISSVGVSPQHAYDILQAIIRIYPQAAANILGNVTIRPVEEAKIPTIPTNPYDPVMPTLKFAAVGFFLGLLVIALFAFLRQTVHNSADIQSLINVPCLSFLPNVRFKARSNKAEQIIMITNKRIPATYLESVRTLRFKLKKELEKFPAKVIMVTSTIPSEGKTTVSANLALSLAEQGKRVILVDGDLRKQSLKAAFNIDTPSEGLAELIISKSSELKPLGVPNSSLLLLCGDKIADQPQSFLSSARMHKIIASLREQMDYVIIDTPPSGFLSDAATLTECVDCVLYVVRQDYANRSHILNSIQTLANTDVHFIGCVLNNTELGTTKYGYGYRYGYGSQYGSYYGGYGYTSSEYGQAEEEEKPEKKKRFVK